MRGCKWGIPCGIAIHTLWNVDSGRRPGWSQAARPEQAEPLIEYFIECLKASGLRVQTGIFRADMNVQLINHGPATLMIEVN